MDNIINNTLLIIAHNNSAKNITFWLDNKDDKSLTIGIGFIVNNLIITSGHVVENASNICGIFINNNKSYKLNINTISYEFDIAILSFTDFDCPSLIPIPSDHFNTILPSEMDILRFFSLDHTEILCEYNILEWFINDISIEPIVYNINSILINLSSDRMNKIANYKGLSGGPCIDSNNKICGMINLYKINEDIIQVIPMCVINRILNEYTRYNLLGGIISLYCEIRNNIVVNNYLLIYKNSVKNNDVLLSINNNDIDENGYIMFDTIGIKVPIHIYIMLTTMINNYIHLKVIRRNNIKLLNIECVPLKKYLYIPISNNYDGNNNYVIIKNYIFIELSISLIEYYLNKGIRLIGSFISYHLNKKYRNNDNRIVILIDMTHHREIYLDRCNLDNAIECIKNGNEYPIINNKYKYVPILKKINNIKIKNINDLKQKIENYNIQIKSIKLEIEDNNYFTVKI
jgi:hypothetical protein